MDNLLKLNVFMVEMLEVIELVCVEIENDLFVLVVVIIVEDSKVFCVGVDILVWFELELWEFVCNWVCYGYWLFDWVVWLFKLIIVVFNVYVFGGGLEFVVIVDICVMVFKVILVLLEVVVGIVFGWFGI